MPKQRKAAQYPFRAYTKPIWLELVWRILTAGVTIVQPGIPGTSKFESYLNGHLSVWAICYLL